MKYLPPNTVRTYAYFWNLQLTVIQDGYGKVLLLQLTPFEYD